jgi:hypothetical protein
MQTFEDIEKLEQVIPNIGLIRSLHAQYYRDQGAGGEGGLLSSHWLEFIQYMDVQIDEAANTLALSNRSLGNYGWRGSHHWSAPVNWALDVTCMISHMVRLSGRMRIARLLAVGWEVCSRMGIAPTFDFFRQVCSLALLEENIPNQICSTPLRILMIGDGLGILASMFRSVFAESSIVLVDIGKSLLFQTYYCQKAHPTCSHVAIDATESWVEADFVYCASEQLHMLDTAKFDIAVNIASMQEMNTETIARYFTFLRSHMKSEHLFYCCNREYKEMPGGEVAEFELYPWSPRDRFVVDEQCPWQQYYLSLHQALRGWRVLGLRVPFVNLYDGDTRHRLAVLSRP